MVQEIYNKIIVIINEILDGKDVVDFDPKCPIVDSGLNSLEFINLVVEIENIYQIELPDDFLEEFALKNICDMSKCVFDLVEGRNEKMD